MRGHWDLGLLSGWNEVFRYFRLRESSEELERKGMTIQEAEAKCPIRRRFR
jgi:hypothetical protein